LVRWSDLPSASAAVLCFADLMLVLLSFFFSSRRRHTRFSRDWSSDVCSSDLEFDYALGTDPYISHKPSEDKPGDLTHVYAVAHYKDGGYNFEVLTRARVDYYRGKSRAKNDGPWVRSEERRVGKERRRRWNGYR